MWGGLSSLPIEEHVNLLYGGLENPLHARRDRFREDNEWKRKGESYGDSVPNVHAVMFPLFPRRR